MGAPPCPPPRDPATPASENLPHKISLKLVTLVYGQDSADRGTWGEKDTTLVGCVIDAHDGAHMETSIQWPEMMQRMQRRFVNCFSCFAL